MEADLRRDPQQAGFTLLESLLSMLIFVISGLALALLITYGVRLQAQSRDLAGATSQARAKTEELRVLAMSARVAGNDTVGIFNRSWTLAAGPAGSQLVTVTVTSNKAAIRLAPVTISLIMP
jgi:Tfp pilus assembly protein PilV